MLTKKIKHGTLSHHDALKKVYELTPQIQDYDKFMHAGARWLPYTMYFHEKNFRSASVNTDNLGFRYSYFNNDRYSVAELQDTDAPINLLVGGSTALGVGSTSDRYTVASFLSELTGQIWLNFSGRGYNAIQELLLFLMHRDKFQRLNKVVILSGINTLALEGIPDYLSSDHGRYYYSYEFTHYMNKYNEDMIKKRDSFSIGNKKRIYSLKHLRGLLTKENPADKIISDEGTDLQSRVLRTADIIIDTLYKWKLLLSDLDASLVFVLQPLAYWVRDYLTTDEERIFTAIDHCPNNFYRLFSRILGKEIHPILFEAIKSKAELKNLTCNDMNVILASSPRVSETLFVDRVHFNDQGNKLLAELISHAVI